MTMPLERGFWRLTLVVSLAALAAGFVLIGLLAADLLDETSNKKLVEWWMKHLWVPGVPFVFWWAPVVAQNNPLLIGVVLSQAVMVTVAAAALPWGAFHSIRWIAQGFASDGRRLGPKP